MPDALIDLIRVKFQYSPFNAGRKCQFMSKIEFSKEEKEIIVKKIRFYFDQELEQDLGQFDAEFLLDFFSAEVGGYYYNRGLYDAQAYLEKQVETISEDLYQLEKNTDFER